MEGLAYVAYFLIACVALAGVGLVFALLYYLRGGTVMKYITLVLAALTLYPSILFGNLAQAAGPQFLTIHPVAIPLVMFLAVLLRSTRDEKIETQPLYVFLKFLLCIVLLQAVTYYSYGPLRMIPGIVLFAWLAYDYSKKQLVNTPEKTDAVIIKNTVLIGTLATVAAGLLQFLISFIQYRTLMSGMSLSVVSLAGWLLPVVVFGLSSYITVTKMRVTS